MAVKRFITTAPRQNIVNGKIGIGETYEAVDNKKLYYEKSLFFPIINILHGYVEKDDEIEVLIITADYDFCRENYRYIEEEIINVCNEKEAGNVKVTKIEVAFNEYSENHLDIFRQLVEHIHDHDRLYACITYGSKPTPLLEIMALNYGYRTCKDVCVECVAYGEMDYATGRKRIYDVTSLFLMDQIVNELGQHNHKNILSVVQDLILDKDDIEE